MQGRQTKTVVIGEHKVQIPIPNKKDKVWFKDLKDPYWNRTVFMEQYKQIFFEYIPGVTKHNQEKTSYTNEGVLEGLSEQDTEYVINTLLEELTRREEGIFFMNGDEIVYLTGDHYFVLVWGQMPRVDKDKKTFSGASYYADYREFQRDFFYIIKHCHDNHDRIAGAIISKAKKTGITNCFWLYYLNRATMNFNRNYGAMNINIDQATKTFCDYFVFAYDKLPPIMRPDTKTRSEAEGKFKFGKSFRNTKKNKLLANPSEDDLNSEVMCVPTKEKAFDVAVMSEIFFDEPTKYKQSFGEIWRTNKEAIKIQSIINGLAWIFNYTNGDDTQSFRETKKIFEESKLSTAANDPYGQTITGLIAWHIPAYRSWTTCFDKYGRCNEIKAMKEIQYQRDKVKHDKRQLQAEIRQYANDEREAWGSAGMGSVFDNIRLGDLKYNLETRIQESPTNIWEEGNLVWENPLWEVGLRNRRKKGEFCPVKWVPLTKEQLERGETGSMRMYGGGLPMDHRNLALKQGRDDMGNLLPPNDFLYSMGGDPTQYAAGSEIIEGSKNSCHVKSFPDLIMDARYKAPLTNRLKFDYFDRPELPIEAFENFLKLIIYTGCISVVEANAPQVATQLMEEGLGYYMIVRDKDSNAFVQWQPFMGLSVENEKKYKLIRTTGNGQSDRDIIEMIVKLIKNYINEPVAGEMDYAATIEDILLLEQLMNFDATNTKIYDKVMSFGYNLIAEELWRAIQMQQLDEYDDPANLAAVMSALSA